MPSNAPAMRMAGRITSAGWPRLRPGATRARTLGTAAPAGSDPFALRYRRTRLAHGLDAGCGDSTGAKFPLRLFHGTARDVALAARLDDRRLRCGGGAGGVRRAVDRALSRSGGDPPAARRHGELCAGAGRTM